LRAVERRTGGLGGMGRRIFASCSFSDSERVGSLEKDLGARVEIVKEQSVGRWASGYLEEIRRRNTGRRILSRLFPGR
jgi:hypothetical protein